MGNIEKPLTWALAIVLLSYLFIANSNIGEESSCKSNNGFNIESENETINVNQEIQVGILVDDENLNIDSIVDTVLEDIDMEDNIDSIMKTDQKREATEL